MDEVRDLRVGFDHHMCEHGDIYACFSYDVMSAAGIAEWPPGSGRVPIVALARGGPMLAFHLPLGRFGSMRAGAEDGVFSTVPLLVPSDATGLAVDYQVWPKAECGAALRSGDGSQRPWGVLGRAGGRTTGYVE